MNNRNLDEQDATSFKIRKEALDDGVAHHDNDKDDHDRAGDTTDTTEDAGGCYRPNINFLQRSDDICGEYIKSFAISCDPSGQAGLQGNREFIKLHWHQCKTAHGHKSLDGIEGGVFHICSAGLTLDSHFEYSDNQTDAIQCPAQIRKEENDGLHPLHIKEFHAHVSHSCKEIAKKPTS